MAEIGFRCPICGELRPVDEDRRGRPTLWCPACRMRLFVGDPDGIRLFMRQTVPVVGEIEEEIDADTVSAIR